jgi:2-oxoisovalerate dehydrogenase E1 component
MPKQLVIDPTEQRRASVLHAPAVPLNQYQPDPAREAAEIGREDLVRMYRDMVYIREFETMLDLIKREGAYQGIAYNHRGPAHLSIGQESTVVGMAYTLTADDHIFGSHRSHGEILAKSLRTIALWGDDALLGMMRGYMGGAALRVVEKLPATETVQRLAIAYILYGTLAEIFARENGFNRGMGGSMHAFFPPFGVMPNNAIVGGSADIAVGAALFKRVNRQPGIVIANIGDASIGCGPVWEALGFASMDQYRTLWDPEIGGRPPILFNFINNFYGMGGQPQGETAGFGVLARVGLGVNPDALHAERVDGYSPLAVIDAMRRKRPILERGDGPVLLDTITYRFSGHSPSDASSYRERAEMDLWREQDALAAYRTYLLENGHADAAALEQYTADAVETLTHILRVTIDDAVSPRLRVGRVRAGEDRIGQLMFSGTHTPRLAERTPETRLPLDETRLTATRAKFRSGRADDGSLNPKLKTLTYAEAIFEAMIDGFYTDPTLIAYGEENRDWGGAFGAYRGLTEALPYHRLFNSPISEAAIVGTGVGYAMSGGRAVVELMYCDFMGRAGDEIFNQMAKWQAMSAGVLKMPLVLRVSVGSKYGAQHSQDWSALCAHIPGLQVMFPATPYDAKGMLTRALRGTDPVVFFESQRLYSETDTLTPGGVPVEAYEVPLGSPAVRREGGDITLITLGATLYRALEAADVLARVHGMEAEVIDARFLNPLDYAPLIESARKTGRVVLASDACERGSFLHTMATRISRTAFDALDAPVVVLGARNWITPPAEMEEDFFPQAAWFLDAIHEAIVPLEGHVVTTEQDDETQLLRDRAGV